MFRRILIKKMPSSAPSPWPSITVFSPPNVETFSCRLRDAIRSLCENRWTTKISIAALESIRGHVIVSIVDGKVHVGDKHSVYGERTHYFPIDQTPQEEPEPILMSPSPAVLDAILLLHHHGFLKVPTRLKLNDAIAEPLIDLWQQKYDIAVERNEDGTITIL